MVDNTEEHDLILSNDGDQDEPNEEEFAFPLFGSSTAETVMTVSMKEEEEEVIVNERPQEYYRATYSERDRRQFADAAISAELLFSHLSLPAIDAWPWKVVDLDKHNEQVAREKLRSRKRRPGMKKRANAIACRERRISREKEARKLEREAQAKYKKKMYKGFKSAKAKRPEKVVSKPKYRTE